MKISSLKHELEIIDLNHRHEIEILKLKHAQEKEALLKKCTHTYDDGTSARVGKGVQWDMYYECDICGKSL